VSQRAHDSGSDSSGNEHNVYQKMLSEMKVHRKILTTMRDDLRSINLRNITKVEVKRYQDEVNEIVEAIVNSNIKDSNNILMIRRFVKTLEEFEKIGNLIIRKFNLALSRWEDFHNPRINQQRRDEAEERYEERLNECRAEVIKLLAQFKTF
jgi:hypothetical protein